MAVTFSGFNGYDFGSIIDSIVTYESLPLNTLQTQQQGVKDKDSALVQLNGFIGNLQTQVNSLSSSALFGGISAVSSNTSIAVPTVGSGAISGEYNLSVSFLAKGQVTSSANGYAAVDNVAADGGSISFTIGSETTEAINITGTTTLSELKDKINAQNSGVAAAIVNTGSNYKLVISSRETGSASGFTVNNNLTNGAGTVLAFAVGQNSTTGNSQNARNAEFTVNGLPITSSSNTVTDAIPGMTVKLVGTGDVSIDNTPNFGGVKSSVQSIVSEYNKLRDFFNKQSAPNAVTGKRGPLANDSILRQALGDIRNVVLGSNANGGKYSYLAQVGLEFTSTGELKLDETKFNAAMNANPADVQKLFQGANGAGGVFATLKTKLDGLDGSTGLIKSTRTSLESTLNNYRDRIASQQLRLEVRRAELEKMYAAADQAMSKLSSMSGQLSGLSSRTF